MLGLDQRATVYSPNGADGDYDVLEKEDLACRLAVLGARSVDAGAVATGEVRAEETDSRRLLWEPGYVMAETVQIEVDGERWNVVAGTFAAVRGPGGAVKYRRCTVVKAE